MQCRTCDKEFHHCGSCSGDNWKSEGYCDRECYEKGDEFIFGIEVLKTFYNELPMDQKQRLWNLWYSGFLTNEINEVHVNNVINLPIEDDLKE